MIGITNQMGKRRRPKRRSEDPFMTFLIVTWVIMAITLVALLTWIIQDDVKDGGHALPAPSPQSSLYTPGDAPHDTPAL